VNDIDHKRIKRYLFVPSEEEEEDECQDDIDHKRIKRYLFVPSEEEEEDECQDGEEIEIVRVRMR